jgi:hypothetical protein
MDGVFKHVVHKVLVGLDKVIQRVQHTDVFLLFLMEGVERHLISVNFHAVQTLSQLGSILNNLLVSLLNLFFFLLETFYFLLYLFFHHRVEILLLDFKLFYNATK